MRGLGLLVAAFVAAALAAPAGAATGNFLLPCDLDHSATDDPFVFPGQPGASHLHDFVGAVGVGAFTEADDLLGAETTCSIGGDTAAYWHPAIVKPDGTIVHLKKMSVYYRAAGADYVYPFPLGLRHIQGRHDNVSSSTYAATYRCYDRNVIYGTTIPPDCRGTGFEESMFFNRCWNGRDLDNAAHKTLGPCGSAFPIAVPQIQLLIAWPGAAEGGRLVSDMGAPGLSAHADAWLTWDPFVLTKIVERCLHTERDCRTRSTPGGGEVYDFETKQTVVAAAESRGPGG